MRALLVLSLVFLPVIAGAGAFAGAAHAQASGASPAPSKGNAPPPPAPSADGDPAARPKPKLGIESLLRPRSVTTAPSEPAPAVQAEETYGGRNREAWTRAFNDAYAERHDAQLAYEKSKKRLADTSTKGGSYTYNPLGGTDSSPTDPDVQKAKAQRERDRKAVEAAEKRVREITVEASLAGVPDAWIPRDLNPRSAPASEPAPAESSRPQ